MQSTLIPSTGSLVPILFTKNTLLVRFIYVKRKWALMNTCQAYASKDLIALVDASSLSLVTTLAFWDVYPSTYETETYVQHLAIDLPNKLASGGRAISPKSTASHLNRLLLLLGQELLFGHSQVLNTILGGFIRP